MTATVLPAASPLRAFASSYARSHVAIAALAVLLLILAAALCAPLISPQNPYDLAQISIMDSKLAPGTKSDAGWTFLLGTDEQGRDMLSAIFYGLRISLGVGVLSTVVALAIGIMVGLIAAYVGGWTDAIIMRVVDLQLSFPAILIALILLAILGQGVDKIVV
ncbi:MAG TPA: ABC transporter permease subunit, partial [Burkholderiales bacterium]|nr:ABC transporter permease subunit [Burkholderiales bacterium]